MMDLSVDIKLRPARIGLLVRPTDRKSVRRFMRVCTCLWGGMYNPIIPVFRNAPSEWRPEPWERVRGYRIAEGYIEFFEPDAFVEAETGLSRLAGLDKKWDEHRRETRILPLDELLNCSDHGDWAEPSFGLSMVDPLQDIYDTEQRFKLRHESTAYLVSNGRKNSVVEILFGSYPTEETSRHFSLIFEQVYQPKRVLSSIDIWKKVYLERAMTPLHATNHGIKIERYWYDKLVIYIFDPRQTTDLIDLWNIRIESFPVLPVPQDWLPDLATDLAEIIVDENRQVFGARKGFMPNATVEFARSIGQAIVDEMIDLIKAKLPSKSDSPLSTASLFATTKRIKFWVNNTDFNWTSNSQFEIFATDRHVSVPLQFDHRPYIHYESLAPKFARLYSRSEFRWTNTVKLLNNTNENVATVLPFNTYNDGWPLLTVGNGPVLIGSEGLSIGETFKGSMKTLHLYSQDEAVIGSLEVLDIKAKLSEPGQIAKQIVEHLGGLRNVHILADIETLQLLNKMTRGDSRWTSIGEWIKVLSKRAKSSMWPMISLEQFADRGIIRIGVVSSCLHCMVPNWHSLANVDYELICERCRKVYSFPQASLAGRNRNWAYRVIGPFSTRDYARGSYSALLALNAIRSAVSNITHITYSTALSMSFDGIDCEADFVVWHSRGAVGRNSKPVLVIGEAKSLGKGDLIQDTDVDKMKKIGSKLPGSIIAISVLKDQFSNSEQTRLRKLVQWGRRLNDKGESTNPVLLLTQTELLSKGPFPYAWKEKDGAYANYANKLFKDLTSIADATVRIYLGLPNLRELQRQARILQHLHPNSD